MVENFALLACMGVRVGQLGSRYLYDAWVVKGLLYAWGSDRELQAEAFLVCAGFQSSYISAEICTRYDIRNACTYVRVNVKIQSGPYIFRDVPCV